MQSSKGLGEGKGKEKQDGGGGGGLLKGETGMEKNGVWKEKKNNAKEKGRKKEKNLKPVERKGGGKEKKTSRSSDEKDCTMLMKISTCSPKFLFS